MTRNKRMGKRIWWGLLVLWVLCFGAGIFYLFGMPLGFDVAGIWGTPSFSLSYFYYIVEFLQISNDDLGICLMSTMYLGLFIFTQWLFLSPKKHWNVKTQKTGRPMTRATIGVAFATSLLSLALIFSIYDLISDTPFEEDPNFFILSIPLALWIIWSIIFSIYFYQKDYLKWSGRIIKGLIGGSILELFISIPVFATREEDCYCTRGSYAGIVLAVSLITTFLLILYLKRK